VRSSLVNQQSAAEYTAAFDLLICLATPLVRQNAAVATDFRAKDRSTLRDLSLL